MLLALYRSFYNRNIPVDIISSIKDLSRYKIVVAPALFVLTEDVAENLKEYVRSGGTLVITFRSAVKDATGLIYNEPLPARLQDVFGAIVKEYNSPHPDEVTTLWGLSEAVDGHCAKASVWLDIMELREAEPLIKYDAGFMPGGIAVTRNRFGKGTAYYIGTQMAQDCCDLLTEMIIAGAGVSPGIETPEGVDASVRKGPLGSLLFITNHTEQPASIPRPEGYITDMIAGCPAPDIIHLDSYEIAVLGS